MEELENVGKQLQTALDRYLGVCVKMDAFSSCEVVPRDISRGYLDRISAEIARFSSRQLALGQVEATLCRVRNRVSRLSRFASISSLPPEILTFIFHLVANRCDLLISDSEHSESPNSSNSSEISDADSSELRRHHSKTLQLGIFPTHLDRLTHVCSNWRRTAINSPSLWTHIDFFPHKTLHRGFSARTETYAARAAGLPIELHVADDYPAVYNGPSLRLLLSSFRNRLKSLDISVTRGWRRFHELILDESFPGNTPHNQPTILTKLTMNFPMAGEETDEFLDWFDDTNEDLFRLTVLHFRGLFFTWKSAAYHNLVDLRLTSASNKYWTNISEQDFQNILEASPGLRILYFALHVIDRQEDDASIIPVPLKDLEVVSISTDRGDYGAVLRPGDVLRLLAPGSKPLRLSTRHYHETMKGNYDKFSLDELVKFFQRSNVTKFHTKDGYPGLDQLFAHASNLEDLVFDSCTLHERDRDFPPRDIRTSLRLNSLIFRNCTLQSPQLQAMLRVFPSNQVVFSACNLSRFGSPSLGQDSVGKVLTTLEEFPNTRLVVYDNQLSDPITKWELDD